MRKCRWLRLYGNHKDVYGNCHYCGAKGGIPTYSERCRAAADAVPRETRQQFLDLMWSGKNLGDARKEVGISTEAASQILMDNITTLNTLNTVAV